MTISFERVSCPVCYKEIRYKVVTSLYSPHFDIDGYCSQLNYKPVSCECGFACLPEHAKNIHLSAKPKTSEDPYISASEYYKSISDFGSAAKCMKWGYWTARNTYKVKAAEYLNRSIKYYTEYLSMNKDLNAAAVLCDLLRQAGRNDEATELIAFFRTQTSDAGILSRLDLIAYIIHEEGDNI